jgi:hypothetical protein
MTAESCGPLLRLPRHVRFQFAVQAFGVGQGIDGRFKVGNERGDEAFGLRLSFGLGLAGRLFLAAALDFFFAAALRFFLLTAVGFFRLRSGLFARFPSHRKPPGYAGLQGCSLSGVAILRQGLMMAEGSIAFAVTWE